MVVRTRYDEPTVTTRQAMRLTGASYRRVKYLIDQELLCHRPWDRAQGSVLEWRAIDVTILQFFLDLYEMSASADILEPLDLALELAEDPPEDGELLIVRPGIGLVRGETEPNGRTGWYLRARRFNFGDEETPDVID